MSIFDKITNREYTFPCEDGTFSRRIDSDKIWNIENWPTNMGSEGPQHEIVGQTLVRVQARGARLRRNLAGLRASSDVNLLRPVII
jgi:hypothetical protein